MVGYALGLCNLPVPAMELELEAETEEVAQLPPAAVPKPHLWEVEEEVKIGLEEVEEVMVLELVICGTDDVGVAQGLVGTAIVTIDPDISV